ncbi:MAG: phytanoyl-CoA dioxygenase family protein [Pseudomonadota bacterium]
MPGSASALRDAFERDGYVFPLAAMSLAQAAHYRQALEQVEADFSHQPKLLNSLHGYSNLVLPFVDEIMRLPSIIGPVSEILGPDLLVWSCNMFVKEARTPHYVSWHQDLTYWGLDALEEVTAWVALSPATVESGCMRFVAGSHRSEIVPHRDTFQDENLLTRGQEMTVTVDESAAVDVVLQPGEVSLHHGRTFHASHGNRSGDRRIGIAIRYITPAMRQVDGTRTVATLVSGKDRFGHFELAPPPAGVMMPDDIARLRHAEDLQNPINYAGAAQEGKRADMISAD